MRTKAVIFGTGSFAELAHYFLTHDSTYIVHAFCADRDHIKHDTFCGLPLRPFETIEQDYPPEEYSMFIAVGYNRLNTLREKYYHLAKAKGYRLLTYISSRASFFASSIGDNCFIFEDNTVQPFVTIGSNVVLWSGNHIGHHGTIGDHVFIASHVVVSGHCHVGSHTFIGVNATLRDGLTIGRRNIIGSGALIMKDTEDDEVYRVARTKASNKKSFEIENI